MEIKRPKPSPIIHERMTGIELEEMQKEPTEQEKKEFLNQTALFRIKYDGNTYSIEKKVKDQDPLTFWQAIFGYRTYSERWKVLDKFGSTCIMVLGSRFTWPEFYKTKEEAIKNIDRWSFENKYFYPPDFK